ncbi:serpin H1-like [Scleropages formosus]|uniref:Serpin H1-like n=1 Tax=Scleropages formosus TaxID=113540 RepID=A0A0P7UPA2_SCLFO|nr:serpin H1-like [Scleropages formosus]
MQPAVSPVLICLLPSLVLLPRLVILKDLAGAEALLSAVGGASWTLALRLYQAMRADNVQNPVFSPLLLGSSLSAVGRGAKGTTAGQFQDILGASSLPTPEQDKALASVYGANGTSFRLHSSSALFAGSATALDASFLKEAQTRFRVDHVVLGWEDKRATREALHTWARGGMGNADAAQLTGELEVKSGAVVLANALNFKGFWDKGFEDDEQDLRSFLGTTYTKVPMMHKSGIYRHYEDMKNMVQVVELGLWGGRSSMILLLPFHAESLIRLDKILTQELLVEWLGKLTEQSMAISLPRMRLNSALSLQKYLSSLGLTDAWDVQKADFSAAAGQVANLGRLHLGGVLHWASLELCPESGQDNGQVEDKAIKRPKLFYADHAFIILVKDNTTGALLLMGALDHTKEPMLHDEL